MSKRGYLEAMCTVQFSIDRREGIGQGFQIVERPTAAIVANALPMVKEETWKVRNYAPDNNHLTSFLLDKIAASGLIRVGQGITGWYNLPETILATMVAPIEVSTTGDGLTTVDNKGTPRRPGRIISMGDLGKERKYIKDALLGLGVQVLRAGEESGSCCHYFCTRVHLDKTELLFCPCWKEDYCSKKCQKKQWPWHKEVCEWHAATGKKDTKYTIWYIIMLGRK